MENVGLIDVFRELNPNLKRYSWRQFGGQWKAIKSGLSIILVRGNKFNTHEEISIETLICSCQLVKSKVEAIGLFECKMLQKNAICPLFSSGCNFSTQC